jgi:hypothetical protein
MTDDTGKPAINLLWAKADATVKGIVAMPDSVRGLEPGSDFAEDYNRLLSLVHQMIP